MVEVRETEWGMAEQSWKVKCLNQETDEGKLQRMYSHIASN